MLASASKARKKEEEAACQRKRLLCEMNHRLSWEMDASTLALVATLAIVQHSTIDDKSHITHEIMKAARTGRLLQNPHLCRQLCYHYKH